MEKHKAIIVGKKVIYEDFLSGRTKEYWDYDDKFELIIDKPPLSKKDSLYISDNNKIVTISEVIRTDLENTIMYKVKDLYEAEFTEEYVIKSEEYYNFKSKLSGELSRNQFTELKNFKNENNSPIKIDKEHYNLVENNYNVIKEFLGFDFVAYIDYGATINFTRYYSNTYYYISRKDNQEVEIMKELKKSELELLSVKGELQTIKRKWWYKIFNRGER